MKIKTVHHRVKIIIVAVIFINFYNCQKKATEQKPSVLSKGFIHIPAGKYDMGSFENKSHLNEQPIHKVELSDFYMSPYKITVGEFKKFVASGYKYDTIANKPIWSDNSKTWRGDNYPMVSLKWIDAINYCNWLSTQEGIDDVCYTFNTNGTVNFNKNSSLAIDCLVKQNFRR